MDMENYREYDPAVLKKLQQVQLEILTDFIRVCDRHQIDYFIVFGTAIGAVRHKGFIPWDDDIDVGMLRRDFERFMKIWEQELGEKYAVLTPFTDPRYACTVTHLQKKGTKYVPHFSRDLKCDLGIDIDIFVFDNIADDPKTRKNQARRAYFWGRLLFLQGTAHPFIEWTGVKGAVAKFACAATHYALKLFHISAPWIYQKLICLSREYESEKTTHVASFECADVFSTLIPVDGIFPLQEVPFENITVKLPHNNHELLTGVYGDYMQIPPPEKRINHRADILDFGEER